MWKQRLIIGLAVLCLLAAADMPAAAVADANVTDWIADDGPAEQQNPPLDAADSKETSLISVIGQLILYTALILLLIYGLIRFLAMRQKTMTTGNAIQLLGGAGIGNHKSVQLIKVGDELFLLGVGDDITLLKEYGSGDNAELAQKLAEQPAGKLPATVGSFLKDRFTNRADSGNAETGGFGAMFERSLAKQKEQQAQVEQQLNRKKGDPR